MKKIERLKKNNLYKNKKMKESARYRDEFSWYVGEYKSHICEGMGTRVQFMVHV